MDPGQVQRDSAGWMGIVDLVDLVDEMEKAALPDEVDSSLTADFFERDTEYRRRSVEGVA